MLIFMFLVLNSVGYAGTHVHISFAWELSETLKGYNENDSARAC